MTTLKIGNSEFDVKKNTYIMGILNVTPDSFSDGGRWNQIDAAMKRCELMIEEGASIIDIGGESTRPGNTQIDDEQEIERIAPVIEKIKTNFDIPVSVDTYKSKVAKEALRLGVDLINDIWGLRYDKEMANVIADSGAVCCLMHNKDKAEYSNDFLKDLISEMLDSAESAQKSGINKEKIILDPGVGFAKTYEMNLDVLHNLKTINTCGFPVLLGCSRKSVIGLTLDLPVDQRLEGTLVTTMLAVMSGCAFVRVHDVKENARVIRMMKAILER